MVESEILRDAMGETAIKKLMISLDSATDSGCSAAIIDVETIKMILEYIKNLESSHAHVYNSCQDLDLDTIKVRFSDEKHVWIDGKQYIRLDRFLEMQDNIRIETGILHEKCVQLQNENNSLKILLKNNLCTEGGPEYE